MFKSFFIATVFFFMTGCATLPTLTSKTPSREPQQKTTAKPPEPRPKITDITSDLTGAKKIVKIDSNAPFEYFSYMLENPRRLAIEIPAMSSALPSPDILADDTLIERIGVVDFEKAGKLRVEIWLKRPAKYDLSKAQRSLSITIEPYEKEKDPLFLAERLIQERTEAERLRSHNAQLLAKVARLETALEAGATALKELESRVASLSGGEETDDSQERFEISEQIGRWRSAWQEMDFETYASAYTSSFNANGKNRSAWLDEKRGTFERAGSISVEIENMNISVDGAKAMVEFTQKYRSERYADTGVKSLGMVKTDDGWKIDSESWRPAP